MKPPKVFVWVDPGKPLAGGAQPGHDRFSGRLPLGPTDLVSAEVSGECFQLALISPYPGVQIRLGRLALPQPGHHLG